MNFGAKPIDQIQNIQELWERYNFGEQPLTNAMLGVVEEVGELSHLLLKRDQKIREGSHESEELFKAKITDAVGDITIYLMSLCTKFGINFCGAVEKTSFEVFKRDWKKFPKDGVSE